MPAKLMELGPLEQAFLTTVNWMEIDANKGSEDYLLNPKVDNLYVVDVDFDHFGVTLMGAPDRTNNFRIELNTILERLWTKYANAETWRSIAFG